MLRGGSCLRRNRWCRLLCLRSGRRLLLCWLLVHRRLLRWPLLSRWLLRWRLGWSLLRLWPSRAARCFWGTTVRGARNQIEFRLDTEHMVESGGQQFFSATLLNGAACAVIIKPDGQQFAVVANNLRVAVNGHPDQTRLVFQKLEHFRPRTTHHLNLRRLLGSGLLGGLLRCGLLRRRCRGLLCSGLLWLLSRSRALLRSLWLGLRHRLRCRFNTGPCRLWTLRWLRCLARWLSLRGRRLCWWLGDG